MHLSVRAHYYPLTVPLVDLTEGIVIGFLKSTFRTPFYIIIYDTYMPWGMFSMLKKSLLTGAVLMISKN